MSKLSKQCFGCRSLRSLTHADRVPVHLEPLVLPAGFSGREQVKGRTYCCLACGAYWVDAPPTVAMLPRFRPLSAVLTAPKPAQSHHLMALDVMASGPQAETHYIAAN